MSGTKVERTNGWYYSGSCLYSKDYPTGDVYIRNKNLRITGNIYANEYHIISSSISYVSGSTKWGNTLDNTHEVTGSLSITGSFDVNNDFLYISSSGYFGIGSNTPPEKLTVAGNISASGYLSVEGNLTASNSTFTGDILITGTVDGVDISVFSSSIENRVVVLETASGSFSSSIANLVLNSGSFSTRVTTLESVSGSAGVVIASKNVVADANTNIGIAKVTQLWIGTSGAETQVTATAAELNAAVSRHNPIIEIRLIDKATDQAIEAGVGGDFRLPSAFTVISVGAYTDVAGVTGLLTIDINKNGVSILSTPITIESEEKTSATAETQPVVETPDIAANDIITVDIDGIQTTPGKGLVVWMEIQI